ncbi:MAG: hypothetical protein GF416_06170 [Candidatus Altiarchaeales archaeon]|nr:hypothetical protein [Candidatus Altiarchaeales archaeon]MBD3416701.1 hypothetical protein [Candidatus Altiarchaeales archaeon]
MPETVYRMINCTSLVGNICGRGEDALLYLADEVRKRDGSLPGDGMFGLMGFERDRVELNVEEGRKADAMVTNTIFYRCPAAYVAIPRQEVGGSGVGLSVYLNRPRTGRNLEKICDIASEEVERIWDAGDLNPDFAERVKQGPVYHRDGDSMVRFRHNRKGEQRPQSTETLKEDVITEERWTLDGRGGATITLKSYTPEGRRRQG